MKRTVFLTFLACGLSLMLAAAAQAQSPAVSGTAASGATPAATTGGKHGHGGKGGGGIMARLTEKLQLSGSQQAAIAPILEGAKKQMKAANEEAKAKKGAVLSAVSGQITPLLNADQQAKFAEMVQKMENRKGGVNGGGKAGGKHAAKEAAANSPNADGDILQRLTTNLNLTPAQQSQIKPILDAAHAQVATIRANTSLSHEQQLAQIKQTMEGAHSQINGILTPAQQEQMQGLKAKKHNKKKGAVPPAASPSPTAS